MRHNQIKEIKSRVLGGVVSLQNTWYGALTTKITQQNEGKQQIFLQQHIPNFLKGEMKKNWCYTDHNLLRQPLHWNPRNNCQWYPCNSSKFAPTEIKATDDNGVEIFGLKNVFIRKISSCALSDDYFSERNGNLNCFFNKVLCIF